MEVPTAMAEPFSIRLFAPEGEPDFLKINRFGWSGKVIAFPRHRWDSIRSSHAEFSQSGVYILIGNDDEDTEVLMLYVGQGGIIRERLDAHIKEKSFWDRSVVFVSTGDILNRAHITWLEAQLIKRAEEVGYCKLDNATSPQELELAEPDKADIQSFYNEILRILPLVNVHAFEPLKVVARSDKPSVSLTHIQTSKSADDMVIVVPSRVKDEEGVGGFENAFLGQNERNEHCWYQVRIHTSRLDKIKYIAVYQSAPISAVTHYAPVKTIESFGDSGKYKLIFAEPATELPEPIKRRKEFPPRSPFYTTISKLKSANTLADLLEDSPSTE